MNIKVKIWLTDSSILNDSILTAADIKIFGAPFDASTLDKIDDTFLNTISGSKIYRRDQVTGSIDVTVAGITSSIKLNIEKVRELIRVQAG